MTLAGALALCGPSTALAQGPLSPETRAAAKVAYDDALRLAERGAYRDAALQFGRADELAPNSVALTSAIRAAMDADDGPLAMGFAARARARLAERSTESKATLAALLAEADAARRKFASRTGRVRLECAPSRPCLGRLGSRELAADQEHWVEAGPLTVEIEADGRRVSIPVSVVAGELATIVPPPEPAAAPSAGTSEPSRAPSGPVPASSTGGASTPPSAAISRASPAPGAEAGLPAEGRSSGIHPAWFWSGFATTVVLGGVTIGSGVDTMSLHADFVETGLGADEGQSAQTRTNALLGVTLGLGVATLLLGLFTDWEGAPEPPSPGALAGGNAPWGCVF